MRPFYRKRLPPVAPAPSDADEEPDERADAVVAKVLAMCKDAFGIERLPIRQNFFDAGATSVGMAKLLALLANEFDSKLKLPDLYRYATVERLAAHLARRQT